jgi:hypothetical protein
MRRILPLVEVKRGTECRRAMGSLAWVIIADLKKDDGNEMVHGYIGETGMKWDEIR